jgi:hypothetical protein
MNTRAMTSLMFGKGLLPITTRMKSRGSLRKSWASLDSGFLSSKGSNPKINGLSGSPFLDGNNFGKNQPMFN